MTPPPLLYSLKRQKCFPLRCTVGRFGVKFGVWLRHFLYKMLFQRTRKLECWFLLSPGRNLGIFVLSILSCHDFLDLTGVIFPVLGLWVLFWVYSERSVPSGRCWPLPSDHVLCTRSIHSANLYLALSKQRQCGMWPFSRKKKRCTAPGFRELAQRFSGSWTSSSSPPQLRC